MQTQVLELMQLALLKSAPVGVPVSARLLAQRGVTLCRNIEENPIDLAE